MAGTVVGAMAIVVLTAAFPQSRTGFLVGLALWGAACGLVATILRNFAAYGAALAGYTPAIIAIGELGATGGASGQAFMLAVTRASEICIGIVCAGIILAGTDFGSARQRLASLFASLASEITGRFSGTLSSPEPDQTETQTVRRELVRRVIALDPVIDEAIGESVGLRYHSPVLQAAMNGLLAALAGWRTVSVRLLQLPHDQARREVVAVRECLPQELQSAPVQGEPTRWTADTIRLRQMCELAVKTLAALPANTPSLRLLADQSAAVLAGIADALDGLALVAVASARPMPRRRAVRFRVPDWLPSLVNAGRIFVTIGAVELFWIGTAWPNGASAIAFAAIAVILFAPRAGQAHATALSFIVGTGLAAAFAAIIKFAVLPGLATFAGLSLALGLYMVPAGALMAQPWQTGMFTAMAVMFVSLLAPDNQISYDTRQFYNAALAIFAGVGAAALSFRLLPPLSPALRTRRLLALTLRDLRRLAKHRIPRAPNDWAARVYGRLSALPDEAEPLQRAHLLAALSVGSEIIHLLHTVGRFGLSSELDAVLDAVAQGNSAIATTHLARLDRALDSTPAGEPEIQAVLRTRGGILAMSEAFTEHASYLMRDRPGEVHRS